jgi:hypothetical protein
MSTAQALEHWNTHMTTTPVLRWGIKDSLLAYIERLEDGAIETSNGASQEGNEFFFENDQTASSFDEATGEGTLQFRGSVILSGHWGAMRVDIHDPLIAVKGNTGEIITTTKNVLSADRAEIFATFTVTAGAPQLQADVQLAAAGRMLLGQQYSVGQELSPLSVSWS